MRNLDNKKRKRTWQRAIDVWTAKDKHGIGMTPRAVVTRWREKLGPTPMLAAGDIEGAKLFFDKVTSVIGIGHWSQYEKNCLYVLRRKWQKRAEGMDAHFNREGNKWHSVKQKKKQSKKKEKDTGED